MNAFIVKWRPYSVLWRNEKTPRELINCTLTEFESFFYKHRELEARLSTEPDLYIIGSCLAISTEKLKYALVTEIKSCTHRYTYNNINMPQLNKIFLELVKQ